MDQLRQKQREETPELYHRLTEIANRYWEIARSAHAEVLRRDLVYADSVSLRVYTAEIQRARIRRALETMFQVQFADESLTWIGHSPMAGVVDFRITEPFELVLRMQRTVRTNYATYEHFQLISYDADGWARYLSNAEEHVCFTSMRDLLARCPDRDAVLDMVSAIIIAATQRPRRLPRDEPETRQPRGVRIRARRH